MGSRKPPRPDPPGGAAVNRRTLLVRLLDAYPTLPVPVVVGAVDECERAIQLVGDGPDERVALEAAARHNLDSVLTVLAGAEGRPAAASGGLRVGA